MKFVMMKDMKSITAALFLTLVAQFAQAQMMPGVKFDKIEHDFGNIKEEDGDVKAYFTFTNVGNTPVLVTKVETSCGCTKPLYPKDSIRPGQTGVITAIYEARGKRGDFHKNLFIYFNNQEIYQGLTIRGHVIPAANMLAIPKSYQTTYSNLAFNTTMATFNELYNTETQSAVVKIYNFNGYPIRIYALGALPEFLSISLGDSVIRPSDSLYLTFTVDGTKVGAFGETFHRVQLITDDPNNENKILHVKTNLKEDFRAMKGKDIKNAPEFTMDVKGPIDFGTKTAGGKVTKTITITNTGKSELILRSIEPNCSCVKYGIARKSLAPGESVTMTITIDTVNQTPAEHIKYIKMVCNDPKKPEISLKLKINITN